MTLLSTCTLLDFLEVGILNVLGLRVFLLLGAGILLGSLVGITAGLAGCTLLVHLRIAGDGSRDPF